MGLLMPVCTCATLTNARTDTRGCLRVEGIPGPATPAHGRAVSGAGGASFGITVRARAFVRCTNKRMLCFRHSCVHFVSYSLTLTSVQGGLGLQCHTEEINTKRELN